MRPQDPAAHRFELIIDQAMSIAVSAAPAAAGYVAVFTAIGVYIDQQSAGVGAIIAVSVASMIAGFLLIKTMLRNAGLAADGLNGGFLIYCGIAILTGIAISLGLLLLVVPALILLARWAPVYGFGLVEGLGVFEAMGRAWEETGPHFWPIAMALSIPFFVSLAGVGMVFLAIDEFGNVDLTASAASNLLKYATAVATYAMGLAVYSLLSRADEGIGDIFA